MLDYACGIIKVAGVQAGLTRLEPRKQKSVTPPGWAHNSQEKQQDLVDFSGEVLFCSIMIAEAWGSSSSGRAQHSHC